MGTSHRRRALLLEANGALRSVLCEALADLGLDAAGVEGRVQALEQLLSDPDPDLLLVDLVDEDAGGEALLSFVAEQPQLASIPLVVMTDGEVPTSLSPHAVQLTKPFDVDGLATAVLDAMGRGAEPRPSAPHPHP